MSSYTWATAISTFGAVVALIIYITGLWLYRVVKLMHFERDMRKYIAENFPEKERKLKNDEKRA